MSMWEAFHFLRPLWFIALVPAIFIIVALWQGQRLSGRWKTLIAPHLLPYLTDGHAIQQTRLWLGGIASLWLLTVIALAGPAWKKLPEPVEQTLSPLVICWDLSPSMLAEDLKPSRLVRSRLKLIDLLNERQEGLTALIAYSGEAFVVTPLTDDTDTIINLLPALEPRTMPNPGSNPEMAFAQANELLNNSGTPRGDILFVTDEIAPEAIEHLRSAIQNSHHQVTVWGVGTAQGGPIPLPSGGFAKQGSDIVIVKLNEAELQQFTSQTRSYYVPMQNSDADVHTIKQLLNIDYDNTEESERVFDQWFEHGQYLVYVLIPFALLAFRRGWLMCVFLVLNLSTIPEPALAAKTKGGLKNISDSLPENFTKNLWETPDQQAQELLKKGDAQKASDLFEDPRWQASAQFRAQRYEEAAKTLSALNEALTAEDYYNQGNALTHAGKYDEAITAFDQALKMNDTFSQAADNKAIAEKLKALQENHQQENQQQDNQDQNQDQQNQDQQNQNQDSQNQESENQDSQNQESQNQESQNQEPQDQSSQDQQSQAQNEDEKESDAQQSQEQQQEGEQNEEKKEEQQTPPDQKENDDGEKPDDQNSLTQVDAQESDKEPQSEEEQKLEQWLRRVPDDPSGLLRKKFWHQYKTRQRTLNDPNINRQNEQAKQRW